MHFARVPLGGLIQAHSIGEDHEVFQREKIMRCVHGTYYRHGNLNLFSVEKTSNRHEVGRGSRDHASRQR
jgi:hypothetical protein